MRRNEARQRERRSLNVLIVDPEKGWGLTHRDDPPGEPLEYKGRLVHLCLVNGETLTAIELPEKTKSSPERLHRARNWPESRQLFGVVRSAWEKLELGLWLPALGILALLVFLMFSELKG